MALTFDDAYIAKINKIVRNFNAKRNRAVRKGITNVPDPVSVSELKMRYDNKTQLNRELRLLANFGKRDALKEVETAGGVKSIKWELDYLKANLKYAKRFFDREIQDAKYLDTPLKVTQAEYLNNLRSKRDFLDLELSQLNQGDFQTFKKTINDYVFANERNIQSYRNFLTEVETIMRYLGYDNNSIDRFFDGFEKLSPRQFIRMYQQSPIISRIYELYLPTRSDEDFRLSTSEDDAKELIDTFMKEKNQMIKKAQEENKIEKMFSPEKAKELEEVVDELNRSGAKLVKKEQQKRKQQMSNKIKRSQLTKKQIKELEELGWDDILE